MSLVNIRIERFPYEEPHHLNLKITAANDDFVGKLEYYCNADDLKEIGTKLKGFPRTVPDEYVYEIGSEKPEDRFAFFLKIRVFTVDGLGHCAIAVAFNNNQSDQNSASSRFAMKADPQAVNRLGDLFMTFSELKSTELVWSTNGDGEVR